MTRSGTSAATIPFHGFELQVEGDDAQIVAAVARRFSGSGAAARPTREVLRFLIRSVHAGDLPRPTPGGRIVYESPRGRAFWYDDDARLELASDIGYASCRPQDDVAELVVARDADDAVWTASRPLFTLTLAELLKERGLYFLHAGAVEVDGGALLLPGSTGAGKSTLTAALAALGCPFLGDDSVFLEPQEGHVRIRSFPDELDLSDRSIELLGLEGCERTRLSGTEKWQVLPAAAGLSLGAETTDPCVLLFPNREAGSPRIDRLGSDEAWLELLPNVLLTSSETAERHTAALAELTAAVPSFRGGVTPDVADAARRLLELVEQRLRTPDN